MNTTWSTGRHNYHGKYNSSSKRKMSKIYKGLKVDFKELKKVLGQLGKEINNQ